MDEKIVVGSIHGDFVRVFSRDGTYARTLLCDDCSSFGSEVATHGNSIVTIGYNNNIYKLLIYIAEEGQLLESYEQGSDRIYDVAISEQFIVSTAQDGKTFIYSNTSRDFPKKAEINQGGLKVAVSNDRVVIGDYTSNDYDGAAYLYKTDGTPVTTLYRQDSASWSRFGWKVAITDNKTGSVLIYSAETGEFIKRITAPNFEANGSSRGSVCASDSYFIVGASGDDTSSVWSGAAYLFQLSEE